MNNTLYNIYLRLLLLAVVLPLSASVSAQWTRYVKNFDKSMYGRGAQMWKIAPIADRWTYFANQNGMVQYDGSEWTLFPLSNSHFTRSVYVSQNSGRIYVGGINEFGYFSPQDNGKLAYHCMSDSVPERIRTIGNVWNICETSESVIFQGDNNLARLSNGHFSLVETFRKIDCSCVLNDVYYIGTDQGVFLMAGSSFYPLPDGECLVGKRIRSLMPYKNGLLIATAYNGLFFNDGQRTSHVDTKADAVLAANELFCAAVSPRYFALGTIQKGIILIDIASGEPSFYSEDNGLQNNTVLSLSFDAAGNLWAGLDSGTDYIYLNLPYSSLYTSRNSVGTGYAAALDGDVLYIGTNRGLYSTGYHASLSGLEPEIRMVPGTGGQVWNLCRIGSELFCMHDRGVFALHDGRWAHIDGIGGSWKCQSVISSPDSLFVGTYDGLFLLVRQNGSWNVSHRVSGADESFQKFEQESPTSIWLHNGRSISLLTLKRNLRELAQRRDFSTADGLPDCVVNNISKIDGRIYFSTDRGVYKYNHHSTRFELANELNDKLSGRGQYLDLCEYNNKVISLSDNEVCIAPLTRLMSGGPTLSSPIQQSIISLVPNYSSVVPLTDSLVILPSDRGFTLFNAANADGAGCRNQSFRIRSMTSTVDANELYVANFVGTKPDITLEYATSSVRLDYKASVDCTDDIMYRYRLTGSTWSEPSVINAKEYSGLKEGGYTFEVELLLDGRLASSDSISFTILPPWYRSNVAYLSYALCVLLVCWIIYLLDRRRISHKEQILVREKDEEIAAKEVEFEKEKERQDRQIMQLEKEKLEYDLQHKSQEMANLMINFVRKNEMLTEIKAELNKISSSLKAGNAREGSRQILLLNSKIDSNIQNDDVLKRIEEQFDLIHNNFMKKLSARHPDLSTNERMMCAYLKMNLSTKEIAPLLNISVRGVETMRYRLRKKFNLEREDGLIAYLNEDFE